MIIIVSKTEFKDALSIAREALSKVIIQEERSHLLFEVSKGKLIITGTNNDFKARCIVNLSASDSDFSFTSDPKVLDKLLSKIDSDEIKMDFDPEKMVLKVYTSDDNKSYTSIQSFPPDKMITFSESKPEDKSTITIDKEIFSSILRWSLNFMPPLKDSVKKYDFLILNDNIAYSANGSNKMGYIVSKMLKPFKNIKIRKSAIPILINVMESLPDENINFIETMNDLGIESIDGTVFYGFLKSTVEVPKIKTDFIKTEGNYVLVDKNKLIKTIDRLVATLSTTVEAGIKLDLKGSKDSAYLDLSLVSRLDSKETFNCKRMEDDSSEEFSHVIKYRHFRSILSAMESDEDLKLYINDNGKFFKLYKVGMFKTEKYLSLGIGSYFKLVPQ